MSVHITTTLHITSTLTHPSTLLHSGVGGWRRCVRWGGGGGMGVGGVFGALESGGDVWCRRLKGWRVCRVLEGV